MTYSQITGGTVVDASANLTTGSSDDGNLLVTLPFSFEYNGNAFTQVTMNTNGWVGMGDQSSISASNGRVPANLFNTTAPQNTVAGWFRDGNANFTSGGSMVHGNDGTGIYSFEWRNASGSTWNLSTTNMINYKISLYGPASTNPGRIVISYGDATDIPNLSVGASIGIEDAIGGSGNFINGLDGSSTSTVVAADWPGIGNGIQFDPPGLCSGAPTAGTAVSTPATACFGGGNVTLSLTGSTTGVTGITYQWESSADNINFTPITGATAATAIVNVTTATYYRAVVTCAAGGSSESVSVLVNTGSPESLPYTENFDGVVVPGLPLCTSVQNLNNDASTWTTVVAPTGYTGNILRYNFNSSNNGDDWFYTKPLALTAGSTYIVRFVYGNNSTSYVESMKVGLGTAPDVAAMTTVIADYPSITGNTPTNAQHSFVAPATGTYYLGFHAYSAADEWNLHLDNIVVEELLGCSGAPDAGTITTSQSTICNGNSTTLDLSNHTTAAGIEMLWQSSSDNSTWTDIAGATDSNYVASPSANTYYRVKITCTNSNDESFSPSIMVTVNAPAVVTTSGASRCGVGSVTLSATGSAGTSLIWYADATGGAPLYTGDNFVTPSISSTTTYYVAAATTGSPVNVGAPDPSISTSLSSQTTTGFNSAGINFSILAPAATINSVKIFPTAAIGSAYTIVVAQNGTVIDSYSGNTTVQGTTAAPIGETVPVNFNLDAGTNYQMYFTVNPGVIRNSGGDAFPYTAPGTISLTSSTLSGYFYYLYDWSVTSNCESARTAVEATIVAPPAITVSASAPVVCLGETSDISVTSTNTDYTYSWSPGAQTAASFTATPTATTMYVVTATDNSTGTFAGCVAVDSVEVVVNPLPTEPVITTANTEVCIGQSFDLVAASSTGNPVVFNENFDGTNVSMTVETLNPPTTTGTEFGIQTSPFDYNFNTFSSPDNSSFMMAISDFGGSGSLTNTSIKTPVINTTGYSALNLTFNHFYQYWNTNDTTQVQASTDGGTTWTTLKTYTATTGSASAFVPESINLDQFIGETNLQIRFRYRAVWGYWWLIDDVTVTGTPIEYSWSANPSANAGIPAGAEIPGVANGTIAVTATTTGTYWYKVTAENNFGCTAVDSIQITVNPALEILTQPADVDVCSGTDATFTVAAAGGDGTFTYQWQKDGVDITGATAASYTVTGATAADAGDYTVIVTSNCGSVTSDVAELVIQAATSITTEPVATSVCSGTDATFTVVADGSGTLTYQWQKDGVDITGATSASYTVSGATAADAGSYTVEVTGDCGAVTSAGAALQISAPTTITTQPAATQDLCPGTDATFTVVGAGSGTLTYQWQKDGDDITGATSASYTVTAATAADAGSYTVVVTGDCGSVTSSASVLTVNPVTTITTQPAAVTTCLQQSATFTVVAAGTGTLTYQWRKDGVDIAGATSASYTVSNITAASGGNYSVVVTGTCGSVTSANAMLTVSGPCTSIPSIDQDITSAVLMPNVVNNSTTLRVHATRSARISWNIMDANGKVVMSFNNQVNAGQNDIQLRLAHLAGGNYYLMGSTQKGSIETIKFIRL